MTQPRLLRHPRKVHKPLPQNGGHNFAAQYALCHYPSGAIYSFIPKNACTTMRVSLALAHGCIADAAEDWTWVHTNNQTFRATLREMVTTPFTFAILRCPHARLASAFLDKIVGRHVEFWLMQRRSKERFAPDTITFREFVEFVTSAFEKPGDPHWRCQSDFLLYEEYDALYHIGDLERAFVEITERTGLEITDTRALSGHGTAGLTQINGDRHIDTPAYKLAEARLRGDVPCYSSLYDASLIKKVSKAYKADCKLYYQHFGTDGLLFPDACQDMVG